MIKGKLPVSLSLNNERSACIVGTFKREFKLPGVEENYDAAQSGAPLHIGHVCRL